MNRKLTNNWWESKSNRETDHSYAKLVLVG